MGAEKDARYFPPNPVTEIRVPEGLDLALVKPEILDEMRAALKGSTGDGEFHDWEGSNNWVVSGSRTTTGKPILANDPHRPIILPSLRKTVHLVAPGWNAIGAGEPALPGIALGHNESIGFGFTIVNIDQMDLLRGVAQSRESHRIPVQRRVAQDGDGARASHGERAGHCYPGSALHGAWPGALR